MDESPHMTRDAKLRQAGFTLIELVFVCLIVAVLVVVAVPSLSETITNQKVKGAANELYFDLSYARSEAIKRNTAVQVIRTGSDWTGGWTVQVGTLVLRAQPATKGVSASGSTVSTVAFNGDGRTTLGGAQSFNFASSSAAVSMRCVSLTASGRPAVRIDRNRNGDCTDG